jgi:hypothetical protein
MIISSSMRMCWLSRAERGLVVGQDCGYRGWEGCQRGKGGMEGRCQEFSVHGCEWVFAWTRAGRLISSPFFFLVHISGVRCILSHFLFFLHLHSLSGSSVGESRLGIKSKKTDLSHGHFRKRQALSKGSETGTGREVESHIHVSQSPCSALAPISAPPLSVLGVSERTVSPGVEAPIQGHGMFWAYMYGVQILVVLILPGTRTEGEYGSWSHVREDIIRALGGRSLSGPGDKTGDSTDTSGPISSGARPFERDNIELL